MSDETTTTSDNNNDTVVSIERYGLTLPSSRRIPGTTVLQKVVTAPKSNKRQRRRCDLERAGGMVQVFRGARHARSRSCPSGETLLALSGWSALRMRVRPERSTHRCHFMPT